MSRNRKEDLKLVMLLVAVGAVVGVAAHVVNVSIWPALAVGGAAGAVVGCWFEWTRRGR